MISTIGQHCSWFNPLTSTLHDWLLVTIQHDHIYHCIIGQHCTWSYPQLTNHIWLYPPLAITADVCIHHWPALLMIESTIVQHSTWLYPSFSHYWPALLMIESTIVQHCTWPYLSLYSTSHHIHYWPALYMIESFDQHCTWPYLSLTLASHHIHYRPALHMIETIAQHYLTTHDHIHH